MRGLNDTNVCVSRLVRLINKYPGLSIKGCRGALDVCQSLVGGSVMTTDKSFQSSIGVVGVDFNLNGVTQATF